MKLLPRWLTPTSAASGDFTPRRPTFAATRPAASPNLGVVTEWPLWGTTRDAAMSIPTVAACRNLIVGAALQMAVNKFRGSERLDPGRLLTQPDPDTTWAFTLGWTIDDLLFNGRAFWLVLARDGQGTERNPGGLPVRGRWIPYANVSMELGEQSTGSYSQLDGYRIDGVPSLVAPENVIRFDSPIPGVLQSGGAAIAAAIELEDAARRMASVELPAGLLIGDGAEFSQDEADAFAATFAEQRRTRAIAYLQGVTYQRESLSSEDLQLVEARALVATEMARLFNMPVSMVSASPSGGASAMLYANLGSQLTVMVSGAVQPHLTTIEQTLSLPTVTAEGQQVAFDVAAFLRSDPAELAKYAIDLKGAEIIDLAESRSLLGIPAAIAAPTLQPGEV